LQQSTGAHPCTSGLWSSRASEQLSQSSIDPYPLLHSAMATRHPRNFNTKNPITYPNFANKHTRKSNFNSHPFGDYQTKMKRAETPWNFRPKEGIPTKIFAGAGSRVRSLPHDSLTFSLWFSSSPTRALCWRQDEVCRAFGWVKERKWEKEGRENQRNGFGSEGQCCGRERGVREKKNNKKRFVVWTVSSRSAYLLFILSNLTTLLEMF